MKTLLPAAIRRSLMFTAVVALSLAYPASVQAVPTTYQYTGNPFTEVSGPYTTSMFVTAMVTLAVFVITASLPLKSNTPPVVVTAAVNISAPLLMVRVPAPLMAVVPPPVTSNHYSTFRA